MEDDTVDNKGWGQHMPYEDRTVSQRSIGVDPRTSLQTCEILHFGVHGDDGVREIRSSDLDARLLSSSASTPEQAGPRMPDGGCPSLWFAGVVTSLASFSFG